MFSLLAGLYQWLMSQRQVNLILLGLDHAGKTTLLEQMKMNFTGGMRNDNNRSLKRKRSDHIAQILARIPPTVGMNVAKMEIRNCAVTLWDLGGQASFRKIWSHYYEQTHGLIFTVDAADPERLQEAKEELKALLENSDLRGIPFLILSNKIDKGEALALRDMQKALGLSDLQNDNFVASSSSTGESSIEPSDSRPIMVKEISALKGHGVQKAVLWLMSAILSGHGP